MIRFTPKISNVYRFSDAQKFINFYNLYKDYIIQINVVPPQLGTFGWGETVVKVKTPLPKLHDRKIRRTIESVEW